MHSQALSAEQTRDLYAEQISDLIEAIDMDRARIAELEAELEQAKAGGSSTATDAILRKLSALSEEVQEIRANLERLVRGATPRSKKRKTSGRTKKTTKVAKTPTTTQRAATDGRAETSVGPFAKYSVLRGAACSLGVGKHGYPPEVCAPAYFDRSEAAEILGTYAQNDYSGLAKWALITGFPIDDDGRPMVSVATTAKAKSKSKTKSSSSRKKKSTKKVASRATGRSSGGTSTKSRSAKSRSAKEPGSARSSQQILDKVLLAVARI